MLCASVRRKGSTEQCQAKALRGHTLCGRHARCIKPQLWAAARARDGDQLVRAQALIRGWLVRNRLAMAGPGVLHRSDLANDEELLTCEPKERQHPFEYFAFDENGKTWWFAFDTIWQWCRRSHEPVNPYTKVPLSGDARKRLLALWSYRRRHQLPLPAEAPTYGERLQSRWNVIIQAFADHGFVDIHPETFLQLNRSELVSMFTLLKPDIEVIFPIATPTRDRAVRYCERAIRVAGTLSPSQYVLQSSYILLLLITLHKEPYTMIFAVLSALYRC